MIEQKRRLTEVGDVKVHNNAIKSITELTVCKIKGVVRISPSPLKKALDNLGIGKLLQLADGIKVESDDSGIKIILDIIVSYGYDISEIATKIQDEVKQAVENMTGISSVEVDVNVTGVEPEGGKR
jgi:uncharacterized alkaline shock family protein YloU